MSRRLLFVACLVLAQACSSLHAEDARDLKIIATAQDSPTADNIGPVRLNNYGGIVIRSAEELVAASAKSDSAKNAVVQGEMMAELAKVLQVDGIDWSTQMIVAVRGEPGTKADRIHFDSLKVEGNTLTVTWKVKQRPPHAGFGTPIALILVDRFEGETKFAP
ncbi:MAG TPA: hypothetical protein VHR66_25435 [Gemmataceae bacterium]|jgi:hypothetical protein|nr:hypothetical protein [Gemmataceae bacterium]